MRVQQFFEEPFLEKFHLNEVKTLNKIEEKEENNVINFTDRKAFGGGIGGDENWLSQMQQGSVFLARPKMKTGEKIDAMGRLILNAYFIQEQHENAVNLLWRTPDGKQLDIWVIDLEFSRLMEKVKLIAVILPEKQEVSTTDLANI